MPLKEKDMDRVFDLGCKEFLKKMENGKFYSYAEMSKLILENSIHRPQLTVIQAQYAVGNLRAAEKDGERYYSKVKSN